ncbi:hypothetical protein [Yeosuana sp.]|uniref:hypothetical protein n=1 Tax=Yeosuana sp. TaxID=2529388 RepID=UPI004054EF64
MSLLSLKINKANSKKTFELKVELNPKFNKDTCYFESDDYLIILDGIILNKTDFFNKELNSWEACLISLYKEKGPEFYNMFRGSFCGVFFDKTQNKWIVFQDHIGSKNIYFSEIESGSYMFSNQIAEIYKTRKALGVKETLDVNAVYMLLSYGYMLENYTLSKDIKKILPGTYVKIEKNQLSHHTYYKLNNKTNTSLTEDEAIEQMDVLFRQAIKRQFDKDLEYGYKHFVALSGGLDSRMTTWVANKMGYTNQLNFTFSQSDYLDETIPKAIAQNLKHEWIFKALDNGLFLYNPDEITLISGGNALYHGLAHGFSLYKLIAFNQLGISHSGQLGDVVFGSFNKMQEHQTSYNPFTGTYSNRLLNRIVFKENITSKYENAELFSMYQRGFNGANEGLMPIQQYTETMSPFYDIDVLNFAMTIPVKYRSKQKIYKKWILKKYPDAAQYIWEKTGEKISTPSIYIKNKEITFYKLITKALLKIGIKKSGYNSKNNMNPLEYWLCTNKELKQYLDNYFTSHINLIEDFQLKEDCITHYTTGNGIEKMQVISLLSALKLFFSIS